MVTRTRLIVTLCILCLSCCIIWINCCIYTVYTETVSSLYYPRHLLTRGHQKLKNCSLSDTEYVWVTCTVKALFHSRICGMRDNSTNFFPSVCVCEISHFCVCVKLYTFLIWNFRRVLYVICILLGNSPASEFYVPTFRNTLSVPSS